MKPSDIYKIYNQIYDMRISDDIEGLTYMTGAVLQTLIMMGCPINKTSFKRLQKTVDEWANKQPKRR